MPHCSSEREEEQFESMVGGAAEEDEAAASLLLLAETPMAAAAVEGRTAEEDEVDTEMEESEDEEEKKMTSVTNPMGQRSISDPNPKSKSKYGPHRTTDNRRKAREKLLNPFSSMGKRTVSLPNQNVLRMIEEDEHFQQLLGDVRNFNVMIGIENADSKRPPGNGYGGLHVCCVVKTEGSAGLYHIEWKPIPDYVLILEGSEKYPPGDPALKQVNQDHLNDSINQMIGAVLPVGVNMPKLNNIIASIVLKSYERTEQIYLEGQTVEPASGSQQPLPALPLDEGSKSVIETMLKIGKNFFNFLYSRIPNVIGTMLINIRENPRDYQNFVTQNTTLIGIILDLIRNIKIPPRIIQKVVEFTIQTGLITYFIELIKKFYDPDISIRSFALAGIIVFIAKCLGVAVRALTPSDNFIKEFSDQGNVTIESINDDLQRLAVTNDDLPIQQLIGKLLLLREYYENDIDDTKEAASRSFNIASINLCDSIITLLDGAKTGVEQGVKSANIDNAKKIGKTLIMFTTRLQSVPVQSPTIKLQPLQPLQPEERAHLARPPGVQGAAASLPASALAGLPLPQGVQGAAQAQAPGAGLSAGLPLPPGVQGAAASPEGEEKEEPPQPSGLSAGPPQPPAAEPPQPPAPGAGLSAGPPQLPQSPQSPGGGEEKKSNNVMETGGGAAKRTTKKRSKKVKTKMLKGKSKKHLKKSKKDKKSKKGKKTGKKRVRFHSSSKKSKKSTRKRR